MRALVDPLLVAMSSRFQRLYSTYGRPSIPPEQLLRALVLQFLYTIRSERQLMERSTTTCGIGGFGADTPDDDSWDATALTRIGTSGSKAPGRGSILSAGTRPHDAPRAAEQSWRGPSSRTNRVCSLKINTA
jgi:hypothetical protein